MSSRHDRLLAISKGDQPPTDPVLPVMVLDLHAPGEVCLRPLQGGPDRYFGPMAGGNCAVGGPEFRQAVNALLGHDFYGAVAIHDRYESEELYYTLRG